MSNIPASIRDKVGLNLHNRANHPLQLVKQKIFDYFGPDYAKYDTFSPYVTTEENFDLLRIAKDHPARSKSDTYYLNDTTVLRTHTSAHQVPLLRSGQKKFLVCGDVYRKDEIDRTHFPVFHQIEGVCLIDNSTVDVEAELKRVLSGLASHLFPAKEYRFNADYFPFVEPGLEMEVRFGDRWLEVLGCGVIHSEILANGNIPTGTTGWAFGFGPSEHLILKRMLWYKIANVLSVDPRSTLKSTLCDAYVRHSGYSTLLG